MTATATELPTLVDTKTLCEKFGISKYAVYRAIEQEEHPLPAIKINHVWRFDPSKVMAWLDSGGTLSNHSDE